jgi:hypothetical protein
VIVYSSYDILSKLLLYSSDSFVSIRDQYIKLFCDLWNSLSKVLEEVAPELFILALNYCLGKNESISIRVDSYD